MEKKSKYTDAELIDAYKKYGSQTQAGKALGVSQTTIYNALKRNGVTGNLRYVKCTYCGKPFLAKQIRSSYCSRKCKDISIRLAKGIPCNPNVEPYHKICVVCGKPFDSFRDTAVTCSHECALQYKHINNPDEKRERINTTEIWVNQKHGDSFEYVSHTGRRIRLKCKCCNNIIERANSTVRTSGLVCQYCKEQKELDEARRKMLSFLIALTESKTPKKCMCCGKEFYSEFANQKYCSDKCRNKRKRNGKGYRSRCRKYGVYYDSSVTRIKVIKRDHGICQICGKVCDEHDLRWGTLGPDFPTVDHIIPLAKGGTHTWGNVQCACAMCNSDKRDLLGYA